MRARSPDTQQAQNASPLYGSLEPEGCHCDGAPDSLHGATEAICADGWAAYQVGADCFTSLRSVRNDRRIFVGWVEGRRHELVALLALSAPIPNKRRMLRRFTAR